MMLTPAETNGSIQEIFLIRKVLEPQTDKLRLSGI